MKVKAIPPPLDPLGRRAASMEGEVGMMRMSSAELCCGPPLSGEEGSLVTLNLVTFISSSFTTVHPLTGQKMQLGSRKKGRE